MTAPLRADAKSSPCTSVARAAEQLRVSKPTAQKAIDQLQKLGLVEKSTGKAWGRVYLARPILKAIEDPPAETAGT